MDGVAGLLSLFDFHPIQNTTKVVYHFRLLGIRDQHVLVYSFGLPHQSAHVSAVERISEENQLVLTSRHEGGAPARELLA